jgi:hypothetical protein
MRRLLLALAVVAFSGCAANEDPISPFSTEASLSAGTSFGHCLGYCETELDIAPREIVLTRSSRDPQQYPTKTERLAITAQEYEALMTSFESETFFGLDEVYGCPDCADGGAEWIEVQRPGGAAKRVTFEHGATLEPIAGLIERIRALRGRFEPATG